MLKVGQRLNRRVWRHVKISDQDGVEIKSNWPRIEKINEVWKIREIKAIWTSGQERAANYKRHVGSRRQRHPRSRVDLCITIKAALAQARVLEPVNA